MESSAEYDRGNTRRESPRNGANAQRTGGVKDGARADYKFIKKCISRRVCSRERGLPFGFTFDLHPIPRSVPERPWNGESGQETSEGGREKRGGEACSRSERGRNGEEREEGEGMG